MRRGVASHRADVDTGRALGCSVPAGAGAGRAGRGFAVVLSAGWGELSRRRGASASAGLLVSVFVVCGGVWGGGVRAAKLTESTTGGGLSRVYGAGRWVRYCGRRCVVKPGPVWVTVAGRRYVAMWPALMFSASINGAGVWGRR